MKVYQTVLISMLFLAGLIASVYAAELDHKVLITGGSTADQQREVRHVS
jgi:hypothetical protein